VHAFYYGLPSDIQTLVEKRNDLSLIKMYEIEKANQELEIRSTNHSRLILFHTDFRAISSIPPKIVLRGANGEIKKTIIASMIHQQPRTI